MSTHAPAPANEMGRLPLLKAAYVMARRDFVAILFSRAFLFFLLGPLFPLIVGSLAGGIGSQVRDSVEQPSLGVMMSQAESTALIAAHQRLTEEIGVSSPGLKLIDDPSRDPQSALGESGANLGAILAGTLDAPVLYGSGQQIASWRGPTTLLIEEARRGAASALDTPVSITLEPSKEASSSDVQKSRLATAQGAQILLFLLSMLLAGMVLSNLVEEKGNKIIEVLAAAIPMDAVFMGKLFAMLAISLAGMAMWAGVFIALAYMLAGSVNLPAPALGWGAFSTLFVLYFSMNYLLVGSIFLAIGSLATTVREVQTMSMPVTMSQVLIFFLAGLAIAMPDSAVHVFAMVFPLSSPYTLLATAATDEGWLIHVIAFAWQALWVAIFIRFGARLFRSRVMNAGSRKPKEKRRWFGLRPTVS